MATTPPGGAAAVPREGQADPPGPVPTVALGRCALRVSRLGLGTAPLAGLYREVSDEQAQATLLRAVACGMTLIDTAPRYGDGLAEVRVGRALAALAPVRPVLATKVGWQVTAGQPPVPDFGYDAVLRGLEESMLRLGVSRVDIVHVHDSDDHEDQACTGAFRALLALREQGVITAIGAGMNHAGPLARLVERVDLDCVLLAGRYTLLDQSAASRLLPACEDRRIAVLLGGVFNSGLLADPRPGSHYDYQPATAVHLAQARAIEDVCRRHGVSLAAAALHFPLRASSVTALVLGARSVAEVDQNVSATLGSIPEALWAELDERGLVPDLPSASSAGRG